MHSRENILLRSSIRWIMCPRTHKTSLNKGKYRYDAHVRVEKSLQLEDNDLSYVHPLMCWGWQAQLLHPTAFHRSSTPQTSLHPTHMLHGITSCGHDWDRPVTIESLFQHVWLCTVSSQIITPMSGAFIQRNPQIYVMSSVAVGPI